MKVIAFGMGFGAAFQSWRNFPADGPVAPDMLALVFCVGLVLAFFGGRSRRGAYASATATATATAAAASQATARQAVNVINVMPGHGAHPDGFRMPSEEAPWMVAGADRPALTVDQLDGMDLAELVEDYEHENG